MIAGSAVKARVVDITSPRAPLPKCAVIDANVLYFVFYPNFDQLRAAGGQQPYQAPNYQRWWKRAAGSTTRFFASPQSFGEFLRTVEYAELEALWLTDSNTPSGERFSPIKCKESRYANLTRLSSIRSKALATLASARKTVELLPKLGTAEQEIERCATEWNNSTGDFGDAVLVANGKFVRYTDVVSDDVDLLTFDGITVHTANRKAINAAQDAGKLVV